MSVRTSVVLPAPRSPESVTKSPACSELAMSSASRRVACSSGSATEKLDVADAVSAMACLDARSRGDCRQASRRRSLGGMIEREDAGDRGAAADGGFERHRAAVQLHERAHQGEAEARAAVARAEGVSLEPIEHLALHIGRDASSAMKVPISGAARISSLMPFLTRRSCTPSAVASMVLRISTAPRLSVMAPASMLARSRMLLMMARSALVEPVM